MMEYRTAAPQDMNDLIDFINMVFSLLRIPHDFPVMLPKVYAGEAPRAEIHEIACADGRVCGVVGLLPFAWRMAERTLNCGYVGSVAVHPRMRGQGVMSALMERQLENARAAGMDMVILGGQRQRYEHYGFTACGSRMRYTICRENVRYMLSETKTDGIDFRLLIPGSAEEAAAFSVYEKQPVTGARTKERFAHSLMSYWNEAWAVCKADTVIGYIMASRDGKTIHELGLEDEDMFPGVIKAWIERRRVSPVGLTVTPYAVKRSRLLAAIGEGMSAGTDELCICLHPDRVIEAMMRLKSRTLPMEDGVIRLGFGSFGTIRIAVSGGEVSVCKTEASADLELDDRRAHEFVFAPDRTAWLGEDIRMPRGWFPLHLHVMEADRF